MQIDVKHLLCPLPVLKIRKALRALPRGQSLTVTGIGDETLSEIELFKNDGGQFEIVQIKKEGDFHRLLLKNI